MHFPLLLIAVIQPSQGEGETENGGNRDSNSSNTRSNEVYPTAKAIAGAE
jgi:hypothetical protein